MLLSLRTSFPKLLDAIRTYKMDRKRPTLGAGWRICQFMLGGSAVPGGGHAEDVDDVMMNMWV